MTTPHKFSLDNQQHLFQIVGWQGDGSFELQRLRPNEVVFDNFYDEDMPHTLRSGIYNLSVGEGLYMQGSHGVYAYLYRGNPQHQGMKLKSVARWEAKDIASKMFGPARPWEQE